MNEGSPDFSDAMIELHASFAQRAAQQREQLLVLTKEPAAISDNLAKIQRLCHSLHGSAAIFSQPGIGKQAERIELLCIELGGDVRTDDRRPRLLAALVADLCRGIDAIGSNS
ncbi:MAG TPA: Hpt domain-containing protein [Stellaceae bacterium]|nr:Hpt domain-containing protein [Stellaceae bacterium]